MESKDIFPMMRSTYLPQFFQFETGTKCNANCKMCPRDKMTPRGEAKWSTINRVIHTCMPSATMVCPFLMQEPFTEKRLFAILNNIKTVNETTATIIYTNMALVDEQMAHRILESNNIDNLNISFYGPTEELYNKWQSGLDWETTKENIRRFMRMKREGGYHKPHVRMMFLTLRDNMPYIEDFFEEWKGIPDEIGFTNFDTFHGHIPDYGMENEIWGPAQETRMPCSRLWCTFTVHCNGNVVPCCGDYNEEHVVGNILEETPSDIWRGKKLEDLRQLHIEGRQDEIQLCKDCTVWKREEIPNWLVIWS